MTVITETIMNMQHFHDFYVLQAMQAATAVELAGNEELMFLKAVEKFESDLDRTIETMSENIALRTFMYLYAASLGEARHAKGTVAKYLYLETDGKSRYFWFEHASEYRPTKANLTTLKKIFDQDWRAGYGGKAWGDIVQALIEYDAMDKTAWIDHVVDIEHNNGTAFSKPDGYRTIKFSIDYPSRFSSFLDYKFRMDILRDAPDFTSRLRVSQKVYTMLERFCTVFKRPMPKHIVPQLDNLGSYVVEWGNKKLQIAEKWHEWASVNGDSEQDVRNLIRQSGLYAYYPSSFTRPQYKRNMMKVYKRALSKVQPKFKSTVRGEIKKYIKKAYNNGKGKCKLAKAGKTYSVMPCTASYEPKKMLLTLKFDLPYQKGYGTPDGDGFKISVKTFSKANGSGYIAQYYGDLHLFTEQRHYNLNDKVLEALFD